MEIDNAEIELLKQQIISHKDRVRQANQQKQEIRKELDKTKYALKQLKHRFEIFGKDYDSLLDEVALLRADAKYKDKNGKENR